jgi:hypothetical protein
MDQRAPPELLVHAPEQNPHHDTDVVDHSGHRIVALLREAADASAENVKRVMTMAHKSQWNCEPPRNE